MHRSQGQSQGANPTLSQGSQSQKSVVIWPERDWDVPRKRFAKRNTTVRPVTFVRTWDSASPAPAPASKEEDGGEVEVFLSQGDGKGSVHSDFTVSPVPVIIPAKTHSEPLFEDDAEEEEIDDAGTRHLLTSPLAQTLPDVSATGGFPDPSTEDEESEREKETAVPSRKKSTMVIAVPVGVKVLSPAKQRDSVSRKSFVLPPESSGVASFSNSLTNSKIPVSTEKKSITRRTGSRNQSILRFLSTTNSSSSKKPALGSSLKTTGRKSGGKRKSYNLASKREKPDSLSSSSSTGKASPAKRPRTSEQHSKQTTSTASDVRRQEEQGYRTPLTSLGGGIGLPFLSSTPRHKTPSLHRLSSEMQVLSPISGPVARVRKEKPAVTSVPPPPAPPELRPGAEDPAPSPTHPRGTELLVLRNEPRRRKKVTDLTDLDVLFDCIQETAADLRDRVNNTQCAQALENLVEKTAWDVQDTLAVAAEVKKMKTSEQRARARVRSSREALLSIQREYQQLRAEVIKLRSSKGRTHKNQTHKGMSTFCQEIGDLARSSSSAKLEKNQTFKMFGPKSTADQKKSLPARCREQIKGNDKQIRSWLEENIPGTT